jgi:hypothetical protein
MSEIGGNVLSRTHATIHRPPRRQLTHRIVATSLRLHALVNTVVSAVPAGALVYNAERNLDSERIRNRAARRPTWVVSSVQSTPINL